MMNNKILLIFSLAITLIPNYSYSSDILYVWAKKGLTLRQEPSIKSKTITKLACGSTLELVEENVSFDSIIVIPSIEIKEEDRLLKTNSYFLKGFWVKVKSKEYEGFVFDGLISNMKPINLHEEDLENWLIPSSTSCGKNLRWVNDDDYSETFTNNTLKIVHTGEGGGIVRYLVPFKSFKDGFLIMNYFQNIFFTKEELIECENFHLESKQDYLLFNSIGLRTGIGYLFKIEVLENILILTIGGGC